MRTRFRTLLLAGAASLAVSGALAQQVTLDGIPANKLGNYKITCTDRDNAAGQPCFVSLSQGGQAASTANPIPVADGADPASPTLPNPGIGSRGWLASTAASNAAIAAATGTQSDAATASGANTTIVGALRSIRDRLLGVLSSQLYQGGSAVSSSNPTFVQATNLAPATNTGATSATAQPVQGAGPTATPVPVSEADGSNATLGARADAAYAGTGTASVVAALKGVYNALLAPTPAGSNVIGSTTLRAAGTNRSASLTTTASTLMAANTSRQGWKVKNDCAVAVWISFDGTAAATAGAGNMQIPAGGYMSSEAGFVETGAMSAIAASGTCALTAREF